MTFLDILKFTESDAPVATEKIDRGIGGDAGKPMSGFLLVLDLILMLERLIEYISGHDGVRWATMDEIADDFKSRYPRS